MKLSRDPLGQHIGIHNPDTITIDNDGSITFDNIPLRHVTFEMCHQGMDIISVLTHKSENGESRTQISVPHPYAEHVIMLLAAQQRALTRERKV